MQYTLEKKSSIIIEDSSKDYKYKKEFISIVYDLINNDTVKQMKNYRQHFDCSCYTHCVEVAFWAYWLCKKLGLDYKSAARAGLLHDLFLYDWRNSKKRLNLKKFHAFIHPQIALENASKITDLNPIEKDIILKHMWPVTFFQFPKYRESFIITIMDKLSALKSFHDYLYNSVCKKKFYRYAYLFLISLVFKVF